MTSTEVVEEFLHQHAHELFIDEDTPVNNELATTNAVDWGFDEADIYGVHDEDRDTIAFSALLAFSGTHDIDMERSWCGDAIKVEITAKITRNGAGVWELNQDDVTYHRVENNFTDAADDERVDPIDIITGAVA